VSKISEQLTVWSKDRCREKFVLRLFSQLWWGKKAVNLLDIFDSEESDFVLSQRL
jgi:hypothetical protein